MKSLTDDFQQHPIFEKIASLATIQTFPKETIILQESEVNDKSYYLKEGLARTLYYVTNQKDSIDTTTWFFLEGDIMTIPSSYVLGKPSPESIELLEDSTLVIVNKADIEKLYLTEPELNYQGRIMAEYAMAMMDERVRGTIMLNAEQRYDAFKAQFGHIEHRLLDKHIASFLSMTPETLSRIKRGRY